MIEMIATAEKQAQDERNASGGQGIGPRFSRRSAMSQEAARNACCSCNAKRRYGNTFHIDSAGKQTCHFAAVQLDSYLSVDFQGLTSKMPEEASWKSFVHRLTTPRQILVVE